LNPGIFGYLISAVFLMAPVIIVLRGIGTVPVPITYMGALLGVLTIFLNWKTIMRIPVVETDPDGITVRPSIGRGRIFVRWEDANGVVIWHERLGGEMSTMVAVSAREGFAYDNYGLYPAVRPARDPNSGSKVRRHLRSWSVQIGKTSARRIARLVNASGKGVPVVEELPNGDTWNHSGPQWATGD